MVDTLSQCLKSCRKLKYHCVGFECDLFEQFRKTAFRIIQSAELEMSPQGLTIKRCLWDLLKRLSESPVRWEGPLSEFLGFEENQFIAVIERSLGSDIAVQARQLETLWNSMVSSKGGSPLRKYLASQVKSLRDRVKDFRILTTGRYRPTYMEILEELELNGADVFCTVNTLKRLAPFSTLITCGPFRENDLIFTAPRYEQILNVRWDSDEDIAGFPEYLSFDFQDDSEGMFPNDFPCRVEEDLDIFTIELPFLPELKTVEDWSFHEFEEIYIKRRRRYRGYTGGSDRGVEDQKNGRTTLDKRNSSFTKITFFDGSFVIFPFDQQSKPPLLFSIDSESDVEIKKRRPFDPSLQLVNEDERLTPGMLVVLEPDASESLVGAAFQKSEVVPIHLRKWKAMLAEKLNSINDSGNSIKFAMQVAGLTSKYKNITNTVRWWSRYKPGRINAPEDESSFKKLLHDFVQYPEWEKAWFEVKSLRGASISQGLISNSNIDQYLKTSVENQFAEILDCPKTILEVDGFDNDVVIIEVADVVYLPEEEVHKSQIDKYFPTDDELLGE